jgi:amino acid adenylation domain-containing protein
MKSRNASRDRVLKIPSAVKASPSTTPALQYLDTRSSDDFWISLLTGNQSAIFPAPPHGLQKPNQDAFLQELHGLPGSPSSNLDFSSLLCVAWGITTSSYIGVDDVVFGALWPEKPNVIPVPFRMVPKLDIEICDLLVESRRQIVLNNKYACLGIDSISKLNADCQHACGFQTTLVIQEAGTVGEGLVVLPSATSALTIMCIVAQDKLNVSGSFDSRVMDEWMVRRVLRQFVHLAAQLVATSDQTRRVMDILRQPNPEDLKDLWRFNQKLVPASKASIHQLIAEQAKQRPNTVAVDSWDGLLSYGQLDDLSTRIGSALTNMGIKPHSSVPFCFENSKWAVVAMLGILKAGCAFVPIDHSALPSRCHRILELVEAKVILSSATTPDERFRNTPILRLSDDSIHDFRTSKNWSPRPNLPDSTAYTLFTSGSTGDPKGVVVGHHAICTSLNAIGNTIGLSESSRTLQFASLAFDISMFEIFGTLIFGGCVCIPSDADRLTRLPEYMIVAQVNTASLTPTVARLYSPTLIPCLKTLVLGGEALTPVDVQNWCQLPKLFNGFGPTECAVGCAMQHVLAEESVSSLIGRLDGIPAWIVHPDKHDVLLPFGAVGELVIEGPTLALGYLNDSARTDAVFIQDPVWLLHGCGLGTPGRRGRVYKTGDLAKYNERGELMYIGRKDADMQVKVRGNRVDLGEIEFHLQACLPPGSEAIVDVFKPLGDERDSNVTLAVFLHPPSGSSKQSWTGSAAEICLVPTPPPPRVLELLSKKLPGYMVPSIFFSIPAIPKTTSDKTDRKSLRIMASKFSTQDLSGATSIQGDKRVPQSAAAQRMQMLWADILHIDPYGIGLNDNFFRLGGDSIGAIKLVREARQKLSISLTVADIFNCPTLDALASAGKSIEEADPASIPAISALGGFPDDSQLWDGVAGSCGLDNPSEIEDIYACTPLQEGLLSLSSKYTGTYTVQRVLELAPDVDISRFRNAWETVVRWTPILRTRLVYDSARGLLQVVVKEGIQWKTVCSNALESHLEMDREIPMGVDQPLVRYAVAQDHSITNQPRYFVWTVHHALYDGWSLPLILERVHDAYQGKPLGLSGFTPFVRWYTQLVDADSAAQYWQSHLDGLDEAALFPSLPPSIAEPVEDSVAEHRWKIPKAETVDATMSIILRAAWAIVASHYTSSEDVLFGTTVSGRNAPVPGIESIIGPTIATIPTRFKVHGSKTVEHFLAEVQKDAITAISYEQTGLQRISEISPEYRKVRDIQTFLVVQPSEYDVPTFEGLGRWVNGPGYYRLDVSAMTLECFLAQGGEVRCVVYFDSRVIESATVNRILAQFASVSQQVSNASQGTTLREIDVLTTSDLRDVWAWNGPLLEPAPEPLPHRDIKLQGQIRPHAQAVHSWDANFTYAELDRLSTRLSKKLVIEGVQPGAIIPLYFEPSAWAIVAMVALLQAGVTFVPIDASQPAAGSDRIMSQLMPSIVLVSRAYVATSFGSEWRAIEVSRQALDMYDRDTEALIVLPRVDPSSIAWIIFTSGSTGLPKGAMLPHSAVHASHRKLGTTFDLQSRTRMLQFSSFAFDACLLEIIATLMHGGCVCVPSEAQQRSISGLPEAAAAMRVNTMILTPTVARLFRPGDFPELDTLVLTGEPLIQSDLDRWSGVSYVANGYGPAECSNICTIHRISQCESDVDGNADPCRIGSLPGVPNWVVLCQDHNRLSPVGGIGELMIEGVTVGHGYLNDAEKTSAAFISDPEWLLRGIRDPNQPRSGRHGRLYKTGDVVKLNEDGSLSYIGRKDTQIKIRGQRVELGEIEHHLATCSGALEAVVDAIKVQDEDSKSLAAFLRFPDHSALAPHICAQSEEIVDRLADNVPAYMIPSVIITMPSIPRSASGKTDRKQLREIGTKMAREAATILSGTTGEGKKKRQPVTEREEQLQDLWAQVLGPKAPATIGLDDSFIRLGGDSITAMKLVSLARKAGVALTVAQVFRHPRLEEQARNAIRLDKDEGELIAPFSLLPGNADVKALLVDVASSCTVDESLIEDLYSCTPSQEGLLSLSSRYSDSNAYMLQHVFKLTSSVDLRRLRLAWEETVRTTHILRTRIVQHPLHGLLQVLLREDIEWREPVDVNAYIEWDKLSPVGLGTPLVRYAITQTSLIWTIHHALVDGWTLNLILSKVERLYSASGPPTSSVSEFRGFVKHLTEKKTDVMAEYWRRTLAETQATMTAFPNLPLSIKSPIEDTELHADHILMQNPGTPIALLSTLLQAAWAILQSRWSGTNDVVFGSVLSGRNAPVLSIDTIIGPTMVTVPVRVRIDETTPARRLLEDMQDAAIQRIPHEQLGLQNISRLNADCEAACAFSTLFVVQPAPAGEGNDKEEKILSGSPQYRIATYALGIECTPTNDGSSGFRARARFDSRVVSPSVVHRMLAQLGNVAAQLVVAASAADSPAVSSIVMHTPRDLDDLWAWNELLEKQAGPDGRRPLLVHELVEERVRAAPNAVAVCAWDGECSYAQLHELSDRLAAMIMTDLNVGIGTTQQLVPLCFERSLWVVVAMLAVLKTGAGIVLLDPSSPTGDRQQRILEKLGNGGVLLASATQAAEGRFGGGWRAVAVSAPSLEALSARRFQPPTIPPSAVCWVLFTSGSTGEPKGVVLEHRAICSSYSLLNETMSINSSTRMLHFSNYSFDISTFETVGVLIAGGCSCIPSEPQRLTAIPEFCTAFTVNAAFLTPSVARLYSPDELQTLRLLALGGEAPTKQDLLKWRGSVSALYNAYGPVEAACIAAAHRIDPDDREPTVTRVGRLPGVPLWITVPGDSGKLAPVGAVGELLIEGSTLARGYLDANQTAAAFVEDPPWLLQGVPGRKSGRRGKLYRTGDLARYADDGGIMFEGRKDDQMKIRGQRTEPGEIEFHLLQCISTAAQVVVESTSPDQATGTITLVAFIRMRDAATGSPAGQQNELRVFELSAEIENRVSKRLPVYMTPTVFFSVQEMPISATGKLDRKRLKALAALHSPQALKVSRQQQQLQNGSLTAMEQRLRRLWCQVLNIEEGRISPNSNFFKNGGDSVVALKLIGEARRQKIQLSVADIFQYPSLGSLAYCLDSQVPLQEESVDIPRFSLLPTGSADIQTIVDDVATACSLPPGKIEDIYPCTPMQEGLIAMTCRNSNSYVSQIVMELASDINIDLFKAAWQQTIRSTPILRTRIAPYSRPDFLQVVIDEDIDWSCAANFNSYIEKDRSMAMGLGSRLARYALIQGESESHESESHVLFVWTIHHSLYDMVTVRLVLEQAEKNYNGIQEPGSTPKYASFIKFLLDSQTAETDDFWRKNLKGHACAIFPPLPPLVQQPCEDIVITHSFTLPAAAISVTMTTVLHVAWAIVTSWHTYTSDVVFGIVRSGRTVPLPSISSLPGPTIAAIPLRVSSIDSQEPISALLHRIQDQATASIPHEHTGLQRIAQLSGDCARACAFQTLLVVQDGQEDLLQAYAGSDSGGGGMTKLGSLLSMDGFTLSTYSLTLECFLGKGGFRLRACFDSRVIDRGRIETLLRQFGAVAQQLVVGAEGEGLVGGIQTLDEHDREDLRKWNKRKGQQPVWVVFPDDLERLTPVGGVGELLIESKEIPSKYLGSLDSGFVKSPHWMTDAGPATLFRTGDLVRYNGDGRLTHIGRRRSTFWIGGQPIDGGEIECRLLVFTGGRSDAVIVEAVQQSGEEDNRPVLAAFLWQPDLEFGNRGKSATAASWSTKAVEIQKYLSSTVPPHMVPSIYLDISAIPRTPRGEVDRSQLRALGSSFSVLDMVKQLHATRPKRIPSSKMQVMLQQLWAGVLRLDVDIIGLDDSFFQLGGDSIAALKLVTVARKHSVVLAIADVFQYPKLEQLAEHIVKAALREQERVAVPFSLVVDNIDNDDQTEVFLQRNVLPYIKFGREGLQDVIPSTFMQKQFFDAGGLMYYVDLDFGEAHIDVQRLRHAVDQLVERHSILRTVFVPYHTDLLQVILRPGHFDSFTATCVDGEDMDTTRDSLVSADKKDDNIIGRPMPRFVFLSCTHGNTRSRSRLLILRLSHAQFDGFSLPLIVRDLATLYSIVVMDTNAKHTNGSDGNVPIQMQTALPPAPQFSTYMYAHYSQPEIECHKHWSRLLRGARMTPIITRPNHDSIQRLSESSAINHTVCNATRAVSATIWRRCLANWDFHTIGAGASPDDVLKTAWALTLAIASHQSDVLFGHTVAGRRAFSLCNSGGGGIEDVVGPCVNIVPVRVRLPPPRTITKGGAGNPGEERQLMSLRDLLGKVAEQGLQTLPFESTGLGEIVERYSSPKSWETGEGRPPRWASSVVWQDFRGMQALQQEQKAEQEPKRNQHGGQIGNHHGARKTNGMLGRDEDNESKFVAAGYMDPFADTSRIDFADIPCTMTCDIPTFNGADVTVLGRQLTNGSVSFSLRFDSGTVPDVLVQEMADILVMVIGLLAKRPDMDVGELLKVERGRVISM